MGAILRGNGVIKPKGEIGGNRAGFRWWGAWGLGVVGGPMCGYKMLT